MRAARLGVAAATIAVVGVMVAGTAGASGVAPGSTVEAFGDYNLGLGEMPTPVPVTGLAGVPTSMVGGNSASYAIVGGHLYAWGANQDGQLGIGNNVDHPTDAVEPKLPAADVITSVGEGFYWAAATDGTHVWSWGNAVSGVLCRHAGPDPTTPKPVTDLQDSSGVRQITGGFLHSVFLFNDGTVETCGINSQGELGDDGTTSSSTPVVVQFPVGTDIVAVSSGNDFTDAVDSDGNLWCWGFNNFGQCDPASRSHLIETPQRVDLFGRVAEVYAGGSTTTNGQTIALLTNGSVWEWGNDADGQIGDGTTAASEPVTHVWIPGTIVEVATAGWSSYAVTSTGALYVWGGNSAGQLGDPSLGSGVDVPTQSTTVTGVTSVSGTAENTIVSLGGPDST
jgi:alpha-tubulin suppressor-like RCC1 family protein